MMVGDDHPELDFSEAEFEEAGLLRDIDRAALLGASNEEVLPYLHAPESMSSQTAPVQNGTQLRAPSTKLCPASAQTDHKPAINEMVLEAQDAVSATCKQSHHEPEAEVHRLHTNRQHQRTFRARRKVTAGLQSCRQS